MKIARALLSLSPRPSRVPFLSLLIGAVLLSACFATNPTPASNPERAGKSALAPDRALDNLVAFTRLLGYVRYFHPSDAAAATNWEEFTVRGIQDVEAVQDTDELARKLQDLFQPIAPTVRVFPTERPSTPSGELQPPQTASPLFVTAWVHRGLGEVTPKLPNSIYQSERVRKPVVDGKPPPDLADPSKPFTANLGAGISALVPLALYADEQGTLPHSAERTATLSGLPSTERAKQLATIALAWNVFQHFYPYFDVVKADWQGVLRETLSAVATGEDKATFLKTLQHMVAQLQDGHAQVWVGAAPPQLQVPPWDWIEDHLVLTFVSPGAMTLVQPGDIVLTINGQPASQALAQAEELVSGATPQWKRGRALMMLWIGLTDPEIALEIQDRSGHVSTVKVPRSGLCCAIAAEPRPEPFAEIRPGIFYADLTRLTDNAFDARLPEMSKAVGIIFDMRGYPAQISANTIGHLIDQPVTSAQWYVPRITFPDHVNMAFEFSNWSVAPRSPRFKGKIAFLTDGRAISYAETYMGIVEHYRLGEIIGAPTAGTNGNINATTFFGQYRFSWTGMKVLKHDGSRHHGVGILPTVPVSRTIQGVGEGRDELLEQALRVVSP